MGGGAFPSAFETSPAQLRVDPPWRVALRHPASEHRRPRPVSSNNLSHATRLRCRCPGAECARVVCKRQPTPSRAGHAPNAENRKSIPGGDRKFSAARGFHSALPYPELSSPFAFGSPLFPEGFLCIHCRWCQGRGRRRRNAGTSPCPFREKVSVCSATIANVAAAAAAAVAAVA